MSCLVVETKSVSIYLPGISVISNLSHRINDQCRCMARVWGTSLLSEAIAHVLGTICSCKTMRGLSHIQLAFCCRYGTSLSVSASVSNVFLIFMHFADTFIQSYTYSLSKYAFFGQFSIIVNITQSIKLMFVLGTWMMSFWAGLISL